MTEYPYMQFYVADYLADTQHLNAQEHGAYMLLLMNYWQTEKPLPIDDRKIARIARVNEDEWESIKSTVLEFFKKTDFGYTHSRVDRDLLAAREKTEQLKESGKKGASKRWNDSPPMPTPQEENGHPIATPSPGYSHPMPTPMRFDSYSESESESYSESGLKKKEPVVASATTPVDNFSESEPWPAFDDPVPAQAEQPAPVQTSPHQQACDLASKLHSEKTGAKPTIDAGSGKTFKRLIEAHGIALVLARLEDYYLEPHWFTDKAKGSAYSLKGFFSHFDELCQAPKPKQPAKKTPAQKCPKCGAEKVPYIDLCKCRAWDFKTAAEITSADWDKAFNLPKGKAG